MEASAALASRALSPLDEVFLHFESDTAPMHVGALGIYAGNISIARYRRFLRRRLDGILRFRQRIHQAPLHLGHAIWEDDPDFNIAQHVHDVRLDSPAIPARLRQIAEDLYSRRLDLSRPPWCAHVIGPLADGNTAILVCIHHALADGMSAVALLQSMHDDFGTARPAARGPTDSQRTRGDLIGLAAGIGDSLLEPLRTLRGLGEETARVISGCADGDTLSNMAEVARAFQRFASPASPFPFDVHRLSGRKKAAWCTYSLEKLRSIAKAHGASINDTVLCIVGGGLQRYLAGRGELVGRRELLVTVPVNVRAAGKTAHLGNEISLQPIAVPLGTMPEVRRLVRIARASRALRAAHVADAVHLALRVLLSAPVNVIYQAGRAHNFDLAHAALARLTTFPTLNTICTNVPGPPHAMHVLGHTCLAMHPMAPVFPGMGLIFPCISYDGRLFLSAIADQAAVPDLQRLKRCLDQAARELLHG